ncbi:MAG: gamma-glutamylcyclotransferase [Planctomycetes bacterium]|nr:gamma-glutamylcyclotransferase [Planctomycetota bacterium]
MKPLLAVYGLLRRGERLSGILRESRLLETTTLPGFDLYDLGDYPAAVPGTGGITVEVYELPGDSLLALLDEAEGVHEVPPLYRRERVGEWHLYLYARPLVGSPRIPSGDWLA